MNRDNATGKRVVVIGAGIVGASLTYHLASKGANVTLVEAHDIASGVTATSFAWLNTSRATPDPIALLRGAAIGDYHRLEQELPELKIQWTGALCYGAGTDEALHSSSHASTATQVTGSQILELEPQLKNPPAQALFKAEEGALDAVQATHALVAAAKDRGATVLTQTRVVAFRTVSDQVTGVETPLGTLDADVVVLAAGTGVKALTGMLGTPLPVEASPSIFIRYAAQPGAVRTLISNADMEVRQTADGTLLAAEDYRDDAAQNHPSVIAVQTARVIENQLSGLGSLAPQVACVGLRPVPVDGIPIIGYLPSVGGVYVCAMHPGVVLAAVVGRLASEEIIDGRPCTALDPCRPGRFFSHPVGAGLRTHAS